MAKKPALTALARAQGKQQAKRVLQHRNEALQTRKATLATPAKQSAVKALALATAPTVPSRTMKALGSPAGAGVLVAEGDSWFDYPMHDVLSELEDAHGYEVESVAHKGDRVEDMAYNDGQLDDFTRRIDKLLRRGAVPRAILLSGGGNDVAGDEFYMLLDHADSVAAGLNDSVVAGIIDQRVYLSYLRILQAVTDICQERLGRPLPILIHGYDHPVPDGRGFLGGWGPLPGPWMAPGFRQKGYQNMDERKDIAKKLIDRFNDMLVRVAKVFAHVQYVDLRGTLATGPTYEDWWANELHPTPQGFGRVADRFAQALALALA